MFDLHTKLRVVSYQLATVATGKKPAMRGFFLRNTLYILELIRVVYELSVCTNCWVPAINHWHLDRCVCVCEHLITLKQIPSKEVRIWLEPRGPFLPVFDLKLGSLGGSF